MNDTWKARIFGTIVLIVLAVIGLVLARLEAPRLLIWYLGLLIGMLIMRWGRRL